MSKIRVSKSTVLDTEVFAGSISIKAQSATGTYGAVTDEQEAPPMRIELLKGLAGTLIPGSIAFTLGGKTYIDRSGVVYRDVDHRTNAGIAVGTIDYNTGRVTLTSYPAGTSGAVQLIAGLSHTTGFTVSAATFRTSGAPIRPASLQITAVRADTGETVTATSNLNGLIDSGIIKGVVDHQTGIVQLRFTTNIEDLSGESEVDVIPALLKYNAVTQTNLPLDANLIGLDPVRLPADGRVPIYRDGDVIVIHNTDEMQVVPNAGATIELGRTHQAAIEVVDSLGVPMRTDQYTVSREEGTLTWANPVLSVDSQGDPLTPPLLLRDRVEHMTICTGVQISGVLSFGSPLPWSLPAGNTFVSSAVTWGDLQARVFKWFTQSTWNQGSPNWSDSPIGNSTTAQYNQLNYPIEITNAGAIVGKWAIIFTSSTSFNLVEEKLGVITTGTIGADCAPINPATGVPYFVIRADGWGTGWAANNAVRFNTDACLGPMWVVRTVVSGQGTVDDDQFKIQIRGDAD